MPAVESYRKQTLQYIAKVDYSAKENTNEKTKSIHERWLEYTFHVPRNGISKIKAKRYSRSSFSLEEILQHLPFTSNLHFQCRGNNQIQIANYFVRVCRGGFPKSFSKVQAALVLNWESYEFFTQ